MKLSLFRVLIRTQNALNRWWDRRCLHHELTRIEARKKEILARNQVQYDSSAFVHLLQRQTEIEIELGLGGKA